MSSLVFVVIVAVWAVYLVQHWVRRRDHLATARSVDRFSEAMRVLERRRALPAPDAGATPRSYAASPLRPARPGRPQVVVKPAGARGVATAVAPSAAHRRGRLAARLRGAALLVGSLAMVALVGLAIAAVLPRWWALVGVGAGTLTLVLVRWSVARGRSRRAPDRAATGARRARRRPAARPSPARRAQSPSRRAPRPARRAHRPVAAAPTTSRTGTGHQFAAQSVAATLRAPSRHDSAAVAPPAPAAELPTTPPQEQPAPGQQPLAARVPEPYDVVEVEAALEPRKTVVPSAADVDVVGTGSDTGAAPADGTWSPVPVPPPTYTLKAVAPRGRMRGAATLPADGTEMALEEEFEDLPRIDLVG